MILLEELLLLKTKNTIMNKAIEAALAASVLLSTTGGFLVVEGRVWEGMACIILGAGLIFARGYLKFTPK